MVYVEGIFDQSAHSYSDGAEFTDKNLIDLLETNYWMQYRYNEPGYKEHYENLMSKTYIIQTNVGKPYAARPQPIYGSIAVKLLILMAGDSPDPVYKVLHLSFDQHKHRYWFY